MSKQAATARSLAVHILTRSETRRRYVDHLIETTEAVKLLSAKDRALMLELINGVLRNRSYLDWIIEQYVHRNYKKQPVLLKNLLRLAVYQMAFLQRIPPYAVISESVKLARRLFDPARASFVNAVLRNYQRKPFTPPEPKDNLKDLARYYSHPLWLVERFVEQFGRDELVAWLKANNRVPHTVIRVLDDEATADIPLLEPVPNFESYFIVPHGTALHELELWRQGKCIAQDASAGLTIDLVDARPGETIIDLCAAPGGKAIALAHRMQQQGRVVAVDIAEVRLQKIRENCRRTQTTIVEAVQGDARFVELEPADAVLVDAPCSGLGVLARRADLRWQRQPEDFAALTRLQSEILAHAGELVKPGGRLIYSTCTIDVEENERILQAFLQAHPGFELEDATGKVDAAFVTPEGFVRTFPHRHQVDGTFAARMRKRG